MKRFLIDHIYQRSEITDAGFVFSYSINGYDVFNKGIDSLMAWDWEDGTLEIYRKFPGANE